MRILLRIAAGCFLAGIVVFGAMTYLDEDFNRSFWSWTGWVQDTTHSIGTIKASINLDKWTAARQAARPMAAQCEMLAQKQHDDAGTLLGVAFIYKYFPNRKCTYEAAMDRVLAADSNNLAATAMKSENNCGTWLARRKYDIAAFDKLIMTQRTSGMGRIIVRPADERIYPTLRKDDGFLRLEPVYSTRESIADNYIIEDVTAARKAFIERLDVDSIALVACIDAASAKDPQNAFYDYLKARILLETSRGDKAIECVKAALAKKVVKNYFDDARREALKIMRSEGYPRICRDYLVNIDAPVKDYVTLYISQNGLQRMAVERTSAGDAVGAAELSELSKAVLSQCGDQQTAGGK
jgi:hypothetical protein